MINCKLFNFNEFKRYGNKFLVSFTERLHIFVDWFVKPTHFYIAFFCHFLQKQNHLYHLFWRSGVYIFEVEIKNCLYVWVQSKISKIHSFFDKWYFLVQPTFHYHFSFYQILCLIFDILNMFCSGSNIISGVSSVSSRKNFSIVFF